MSSGTLQSFAVLGLRALRVKGFKFRASGLG